MALSLTTISPVAPQASASVRGHPRKIRWKAFKPYLMLAPGIVLFLTFMAAPIAYTFALSFQKKQIIGLGLGAGAQGRAWAGLSNYVSSLTNSEFLASVGRVLLYGAILVPVMLGLALLFALLLDFQRTRAKSFSRTSIFLPYAVPAIISSLLWGFLYLPSVSPFYFLAAKLGWSIRENLSPNWVIFGIANIALWGGVGFNMIVIYTSLQAVPREI